MYMEDAEAIDGMLKIPQAEWDKIGPPPLFGWNDLIDKLTDLGDQLIAQRAASAKGVKYYPRPRIPAIELRKKRARNRQDNDIEAARQRNRERREANGMK